MAALLSLANSLNASIDYILGDELKYNKITDIKNDEWISSINHEIATLTEKQKEFIHVIIIKMKEII